MDLLVHVCSFPSGNMENRYSDITGFQIRVCDGNVLFLFLNKKYVVDTRKDQPIQRDGSIKNLKHIFKLMGKFTLKRKSLSGSMLNDLHRVVHFT